MRRKEEGDIVGHSFADRSDPSAISGLSCRRKRADHRRGGEA
jgi:hypothetical protein